MNDYDQQQWFDLYTRALLELEHAAVTGRIGEARAEMALRLETLKLHPGLHRSEHHAIEDALSNLRSLEQQEARFAAAEDEKRLIQRAVQNLQRVAPTFQGPNKQENSE
jgi:hypothetical protein